MKATKHARQRFAERFPGLDMDLEFQRATCRASQKTLRTIKRNCPQHKSLFRKDAKHQYVRLTPEGIVFIMASVSGTIITVLSVDIDKSKLTPEHYIGVGGPV